MRFHLLALSTYPVFLCFLHCLLNPPVCFPVFFCSFCFIYHFFFKSLLSSQRSRTSLVTHPKYLTGCISHCCIVGGYHGIDVHVLRHDKDVIKFIPFLFQINSLLYAYSMCIAYLTFIDSLLSITGHSERQSQSLLTFLSPTERFGGYSDEPGVHPSSVHP